jgi:acetamidase/formamidase
MRRLTRDHTVPLGSRYRVLEPVLTVDPGETVLVETINHMSPIVWSEADLAAHGSPEYREREETGPIFVRGARPGDALAVRIRGIELVGLPHAHGSGPLAAEYPQHPRVFAVADGFCQLPGGARVPVAPMVGDVYTTPPRPDAPGIECGGNVDFTEIRPGNTLHLPAYHEGGLLVLGDVHAFQGDGELLGEGGECAAEVTVTLDVDRVYRYPRPLVETPDCLIGLARDKDLFASIQVAVRDMTQLIARLHGLTESAAYLLVCAVGSLRFAGSLAQREWLHPSPLVALSLPKQAGRGGQG